MGASHSHLARRPRSRSIAHRERREDPLARGFGKSWSTNTSQQAAAFAQGDVREDDEDVDVDPDLEEEEELSVSFGYRCRNASVGPEERGDAARHFIEQLDLLHSSDGSPASKTSMEACGASVEGSCDAAGGPVAPIGSGGGGGGAGGRGGGPPPPLTRRRASSFSQLSGAALPANATLANTTVGNNSIGSILLPGLDSPREFRALPRNTSGGSGGSSTGRSPPSSASPPGAPPGLLGFPSVGAAGLARSAPSGFLGAEDVQMAGGAAGEDRVQAVCSEENGWLFCGVYDGFNGRDAADFLAAHLYESLGLHLQLLQYQQPGSGSGGAGADSAAEPVNESEGDPTLLTPCPACGGPAVACGCSAWVSARGPPPLLPLPPSRFAAMKWDVAASSPQPPPLSSAASVAGQEEPAAPAGESPEETAGQEKVVLLGSGIGVDSDHRGAAPAGSALLKGGSVGARTAPAPEGECAQEAFRAGVVRSMKKALAQLESDFVEMVDQEMSSRQDLAMVGSCVLSVLMHGSDLFTLNLGDSRAVLATQKQPTAGQWAAASDGLFALQLTEIHNTDQEAERERVVEEHREDPTAILNRRVKGKLRVTRAFGAAYMKHARFNDALMGLLRVRNLDSPPYVSREPYVAARTVGPEDRFLVLGSDGLFDFYSNEEVVDFVWRFVRSTPGGDPAKFLLEQLLLRVAEQAGMTLDELKSVPFGRRRKYHDDVTVIVISLGSSLRTTSASTLL